MFFKTKQEQIEYLANELDKRDKLIEQLIMEREFFKRGLEKKEMEMLKEEE